MLYPPVGALADSAGGLAGARLLSLVFMLASTVLAWDVSSRLCGRRAGFFTAAPFAVLGPTLHLGAFATYDAMSLFLLAVATWLAATAGPRAEATGRMAVAGAVLALANATAYATALFDPVVVMMAVVTAWPAGRRVAARRAAIMVAVTAAVLIAGLLAGREHLPDRDQADHAAAGTGQRPLAHGAAARLVLDRGDLGAGPVRGLHQLVHPPGPPPHHPVRRAGPSPPCSARPSRPSCTPPTR